VQRPRLKLVRGERWRGFPVGAVTVVPASPSDPPFRTGARVLEEDTWLLLRAPPRLQESPVHPVRLLTEVTGQRPRRTGSLIPRADSWLAIVYDLDQDPICRPEWVASAYAAILGQARAQGCRDVALPLLGTAYGVLSWSRSLTLLTEAAADGEARAAPVRLWLQAEAPLLEAVRGQLADAGPGQRPGTPC
jgi:hypothetical protein